MAPSIDYEKLEPGYQVARLRLLHGLSQSQLAEMVGTKQPSIARLENGQSSPSLSFLEKIAKALGAEVKIRLELKNSLQGVRETNEGDKYEP